MRTYPPHGLKNPWPRDPGGETFAQVDKLDVPLDVQAQVRTDLLVRRDEP